MDVPTATLIGICVTVLGQVVIGILQYLSRARIEDIHVATNGMKKQLEDQNYTQGASDQRKSDAGGPPIKTFPKGE